MSNYVFVYGTLQRSEKNSLSRIPNAVFIGTDVTVGADYSMVDFGPFPAVITNGNYPVAGELWLVDNNGLEILDTIESYPIFYDRVRVILTKHKIDAYMYVMHSYPAGAIDVDPIGGKLVW